MAPGAHGPSLQADTTTYTSIWKSCAPAGIIHQKGLVWSNLGLRWDGGLHAALSLSIPLPHHPGAPTKPQLRCYRAPMQGPYKDHTVLFLNPPAPFVS